jgi:hypothetical protein
MIIKGKLNGRLNLSLFSTVLCGSGLFTPFTVHLKSGATPYFLIERNTGDGM